MRDTRSDILDVAERHFATMGYAGTSLRGVIKEAGVNVAAVAYHFGTKEQLFMAVVERFALPVVTEQLRALDAALAHRRARLRDVLEAFYGPPIRHVRGRGEGGEVLSQFLGRMQTEGEPVYGLVDPHFADCRNRFIEALARFMPEADEAELHWRFEFMLSLIVCYLTRGRVISERFTRNDDVDPLTRLVLFCSKGMAGAPPG